MNIDKFIKWAKEGRRSVDITINNQVPSDFKVRVWCYDFNLATGVSVGIDENPPTAEHLTERKRNHLKAELDAMEAKP